MLKINCKKVFEVKYQVSPQDDLPEVVCVFFGTYIMSLFNDHFGESGHFVAQDGRIFCGYNIAPERIRQAVSNEDYEEIMHFLRETGWIWQSNDKVWTRNCHKTNR